MATSTLVIVPMVVFALFLQKYLIRGMMLGAVKG
jgi:ABC-type glycerol-3-phosphate transport system permease component